MTKVYDLTSIISTIESKDKANIERLLLRFDIEYTDDRSKVKHYTINYDCNTDNEVNIEHALALISNACWFTFCCKLADAKHKGVEPGCLLKEGNPGENTSAKLKIGKVFVSGPMTLNSKESLVPSSIEVYAFGYPGSVHGEINFGIELYD